jgi:phage tail sheath protein FI
MPEYLTPGVYIEEIERGPKPIEGVPTSTSAFLGETERGPVRPTLITSYKDYLRYFGNTFTLPGGNRYMPQAASGFFENGGKRLYGCRVVGNAATIASRVFGDFTVSAVGPGSWGLRVLVRVRESSTKDRNNNPIGFRLQFSYWTEVPAQIYDPFDPANNAMLPRPQYQEDYDDLTVDPNSSDFFEKRLIDSTTNQPTSVLATIARTQGTNSLPANNAAPGEFLDQNGADDPTPLGSDDFQGLPTGQRPIQGLAALELDAFREVAIVHAPRPPANATAIHSAIIGHCERLRFRFAVIDPDLNDQPANLDPRTSPPPGFDTQYGAVYAPWIVISDPQTGARTRVPPGGHMIGIYARTDIERGVFKAPANEIVRGALDVVVEIDDNTQGVMNPRGVNAIRKFPGRGIRVWGARTLSSNGLWKYVSVRRLFIFLERSIYEGTQWVVFEPNEDKLWARVKDSIRLFLRTQWRNGALFGRTEDEAFFITIDRTTMTQDDILNGRLIAEIGIAPVRPAEFVIFRIFQYTAEAQR